MMAIGWFVDRASRRRRPRMQSPFAFQGASPGATAQAPATYRPENVGNDASARPWERSSHGV